CVSVEKGVAGVHVRGIGWRREACRAPHGETAAITTPAIARVMRDALQLICWLLYNPLPILVSPPSSCLHGPVIAPDGVARCHTRSTVRVSSLDTSCSLLVRCRCSFVAPPNRTRMAARGWGALCR